MSKKDKDFKNPNSTGITPSKIIAIPLYQNILSQC